MNNSDIKSVGAAPLPLARVRGVEAWRPAVVFDVEPAVKTGVSTRLAERSVSDYRPQERRPAFERREEADRRWERVLRVTESAQRTVTVEATETLTVVVDDERAGIIDMPADVIRLLPPSEARDAAGAPRLLSPSSGRDPAVDLAATGARAVERYAVAGAAARAGPRLEMYASPARDSMLRGDPPSDQQGTARSTPSQRAPANLLLL